MSSVADLERWFADGHTDPDLAHYTIEYLRRRGEESFSSLDLPATLRLLAGHQDDIGWRNMLEGKISTEFRRIQEEYIVGVDTRLTAVSWTRQFISRLLHISHGQWIYRNITLHHARYGAMVLQERTRMLREIDRYMELDPAKVPKESQFLLEVDFQQFQDAPTELLDIFYQD